MIRSAKARLSVLFRRWLSPDRPRRHTAHFEHVLGTSLELQFVSTSDEAGPKAEERALAEITRLESIFSGYTPSSEFWRWQATLGQDVAVSAELAEVLDASESWRARTLGAFNPAVESLTRIWTSHSGRNLPPDDESLADMTRDLGSSLWTVDHKRGTARRLTSLPVSLDSIAKGYIIDAACSLAARTEGVRDALVNIGGDLRHIGVGPIVVGITNPFANADNSPPVEIVKIRNRGLATSGNYRRGFRIRGQWFSHVIDPRSGRPTDHVVSASVIAKTAAQADVLATAFSVLAPQESIDLADSYGDVACLLIADDGKRLSNKAWKEYSVVRR